MMRPGVPIRDLRLEVERLSRLCRAELDREAHLLRLLAAVSAEADALAREHGRRERLSRAEAGTP